jgi:hypothetical protein
MSAIALLKQLRGLVPTAELQGKIDQVIADENVVENVGRHEVGKIVRFAPDTRAPLFGTEAKVMRNRATSNGKVLYDLALTDGDSEEGYYERYPIIGVDACFVRSLDPREEQLGQNAETEARIADIRTAG